MRTWVLFHKPLTITNRENGPIKRKLQCKFDKISNEVMIDAMGNKLKGMGSGHSRKASQSDI